jgi:hypothetical protein
MHPRPVRPRPRATSAIVVGFIVSGACAATVLGVGRYSHATYPPITPKAAAAARYIVESNPMDLGAASVTSSPKDAGRD